MSARTTQRCLRLLHRSHGRFLRDLYGRTDFMGPASVGKAPLSPLPADGLAEWFEGVVSHVVCGVPS